jgi:hypothetical protein
MIATAIGNPMANAPPIAKVNAESRFPSGRRLSTDMLLAPLIRKPKKPSPGRSSNGVLARAHCPEAPGKGCLNMVNKVLIAGHGLITNLARREVGCYSGRVSTAKARRWELNVGCALDPGAHDGPVSEAIGTANGHPCERLSALTFALAAH